MFRDKRAEGTAFGWILALVTLLVLGILFIMLNQAVHTQIQPAFDNVKQIVAIEGQHLNASQIAEMNDLENKYVIYWEFTPVLIFLIVIIWVIFNTVRKYKEDMYQ